MKETYTAAIDLEITARELAEFWINGNRNQVIRALESDHPGLTALLLTQFGPANDGILDETDCNVICNRLIDARAERCM